MSDSDAVSRPARPGSIWAVYLIMFLQGAAVVMSTIISTVTERAEVLDAVGQIALVVLFILSGIVLILLGFQIFLGNAGARTPSMVLQLLLVVLSFSFFGGGNILMGLAFLMPAAIALVLLFIRPTQQWLDA